MSFISFTCFCTSFTTSFSQALQVLHVFQYNVPCYTWLALMGMGEGSKRICFGVALLDQLPMSVGLVGRKAKAATECWNGISGCMGRHASHIQPVTALHPMRGDAKLDRGISIDGVLHMTAVICTLQAFHIQAVTALHPMRGDAKLERGISMHGVLHMTVVSCALHAFHIQAVTGIAAHHPHHRDTHHHHRHHHHHRTPFHLFSVFFL